MDIPSAISAVASRRDLSGAEMTEVMRTIMQGEATPAQIGGFLVGLRMKGETVEEIAAAAGVMRELATPVQVSPQHLVDTCGTGGDAKGTFNISTTSAFVASAAGARVAKHGNRSVSSKSGSADVLEAAGVNLDLEPDQVARCIDEVGLGFLFAPRHHAAMRHAIGPRREMGVRTVFNLLGPLTNPAGAPNQVLGVFSGDWVEALAEVLARLGTRHALVVHSEDGLDEISTGAPTRIAELKNGTVSVADVAPQELGVRGSDLSALMVGSAEESLAMMQAVLQGSEGVARDVVALNAGAALYVSGLAESIAEGVAKAEDAIRRGAAKEKLDALVELSNSF